MPAADSLAALMKEWPLNSITLSTATHSKLREALDGTDTQVATCTSNRWTARMKGAEEYITREVSRRRRIAIRKTLEGPSCAVSEEEKKNSSSDRLSPLLYAVGDPTLLLTKSSQKPSSWARFSTKFIVLGLLDLGLLTPTMKDPSNRDPTVTFKRIDFWKSFSLWRPLLMITLYHQIKTPISFWCRDWILGLLYNPQRLYQLS